MNLQNVIVVVLRLLALNFVLGILVQTAPTLVHHYMIFIGLPPAGKFSGVAVLPWLVLTVLFLGAVLLWVFAPSIARLVARRGPQEIGFGAMSLADCYSIAFIGVGLFYISSQLGTVLNWTHYLLKAASTKGDAWKDDVDFYQACQAYVPFIVGVMLFVNGRTWALALARKHKPGSAESQSPGKIEEPTFSGDAK